MEKVLVIVGPTGVGKTELSIHLAKQLQGEIISGDSMQVYQEMTIGTAKIRKEEKQEIPHYLIDAYTLKEEYHVKLFQTLARTYISDIRKRNGLPIICGGTGLYIKSVIYDYQFQEQETDTAFLSYLQSRSTDELWGLLRIVDPITCETIHHNNRQRILRALCMAHEGTKKSAVVEAQEHQPVYDAFIIGLTMDREPLYERINQRVDRMMEDGLLEEVSNLIKKHENIWQLQSFQGIGYKEWKEYFEGTATIEECVEKIKKNSRNFAKRQYTWFRNQMDVHWYDVTEKAYHKKIEKELNAWLNN